MVFQCAFTNCPNKAKKWAPQSFHHFPRRDKERAKLWLRAAGLDPNTPPEVLCKLVVCSDHFRPEDFKNDHTRASLTTNAVPSVFKGAHRDHEQGALLDGQMEQEEKPSVSSIEVTLPYGRRASPYQLSHATLPSSHSSFPVMLIPAVKPTPVVMPNVNIQTMKCREGTSYLPVDKTVLAEPLGKHRKRPRMEIKGEVEETTIQVDAPAMAFNDSDNSESVPDYEDTKYIVFERNLLELFAVCPVCCGDCNVQRRRCGTFVSFDQLCPRCRYSRKWQNQPVVKSTPVGDLQLSAAVYFSGGSFQKMQRISKAMNLQIQQLDTFRRHSRMFLEPAINHVWNCHQERMFEELKEKREVALGCDLTPFQKRGTKLGSYTTMDLNTKNILDIQVVQSKETGSKVQLEKKGLKRCLERLESSDLKVDYVVTDRHNCVQKYLQNKQIPQFYDVWHLEKDLSKKLDELSEKKDFQLVKKWSPAIKHHLFWSAASSKTAPEKVAKWTSLVNHIQDVHIHSNPLYPRCAHPERVSRDPNKWFKPGSKPLCAVEKLLLNKRTLHDVEKLCSDHQTSALDVFHATSRQFTPNETQNFSVTEMTCRLFLAAMHFNENLAREQVTCVDSFLLTKPQQGCSRENPARTKKTYGYVRGLLRLVFTEVFMDPSLFVESLKRTQVPSKDPCPVTNFVPVQ